MVKLLIANYCHGKLLKISYPNGIFIKIGNLEFSYLLGQRDNTEGNLE